MSNEHWTREDLRDLEDVVRGIDVRVRDLELWRAKQMGVLLGVSFVGSLIGTAIGVGVALAAVIVGG